MAGAPVRGRASGREAVSETGQEFIIPASHARMWRMGAASA